MDYTSESDILIPRDPLQHSDEWPIFNLSSADVFHPSDPSKPVNLLHAGADNALCIRGKLGTSGIARQLCPSAKRFVSKGQKLSIEITEVKQFAYGQYSDGSIEIWAAGRAGWYSLRPSREYKEVYLEDVVPAIEMLYFAADAHQNMKGSGKKDVGDLFSAWAEEKAMDEDDSAREFYRHRKFLLASMLAGKEGISWSRNPLYKHLQHRFPHDVDVCKQRLGLKPARTSKSATPTSQSGSKRKRATTSDEQPLKRTKSAIANDGNVNVYHRTDMSMDTLSSDTNASSTGQIEVRRSKRGGSEMTIDENPISTPKDKALGADGTTESDLDDLSGRTGAKKGKSVLRPKPSKFIPKQNIVNDESDEKPPSSPVRPLAAADRILPARVSAKVSTSLPMPKRRSSRRGAEATDQAAAGAKDVDEGIDMSLDQAEEEESANSDAAVSGVNEGIVIDGQRFEFTESHLKAKDEGDTWICPLDGCMHRVYAASESASQDMIKEHYRLHVDKEDNDTRMQLVQRMKAPGLPVNRLMNRIQMLAGKGFPAPITRRF